MTRIQRVVFDSSTLVSALLRRRSPPREALLEAIRHCDLCGSVDTLAEIEEVLERSKLDRYLERERRRAFVSRLRRETKMFVVEESNMVEIEPPCRDSNDDKFLALALVSSADAIVCSDRDLLALNPWRGIPIMTPAEFLVAISTSRS